MGHKRSHLCVQIYKIRGDLGQGRPGLGAGEQPPQLFKGRLALLDLAAC